MSKIKVLLVDDEEAYVKTMAERMQMRDVGSRVALSGEEALELVDEETPDVMVLDLRMPGIDGMEVLERVKKDHPHVEVIILTGHGSDLEEKEARRLGAFEYLQKPADTSQLLRTIRAAWTKGLKATVEFLKDSKDEFERSMSAAAMAGADAPEMARELLDERAPARPVEPTPELDETSKPPLADTLNVLLVDDEEDLVRTIAERMEMRDLGSQVALDGEEALAKLAEDIPDVMVLDLRMPGIDGMEVLERVKKDHPNVEVIILTGHGSDLEEKEARRLGAFDYLRKPADTGQLLRTIRSAWTKGIKATVEFLKDSQDEFERSMSAAAMAGADAPEMARELLDERAPARPVEPTPELDETSKPPLADTLNVLLVDDEEDLVRTIAERMEMRDLGSQVALDGEEALAKLAEDIPDVMVLDLRMPGIDGMEVLRRVKKTYPQIEVIIMTGHGSDQDEREARKLGAFAYMRKPVDMNDLMDVVREAGRARRERG